MTVTIKCDLCQNAIDLEPGKDTGSLFGALGGWDWFGPSQYSSYIHIKRETICPKCQLTLKRISLRAQDVAKEAIRAKS